MKFKLVIPELISILFIFLWIYAAVSKLVDYQKFRVQLGQSPLLTSFADWVVWFVPAIEILIAILLIFNKTRFTGLFASFSMMVLFTGYIIAITRFSEHVPCSCGGILEKLDWNQHLIFNIGFVFLGFSGIIMYHKQTHYVRSGNSVT